MIDFLTSFMGRRGPKSVGLGLLRVRAVQWLYLLIGLRDGHADVLQKLRWGPWTGKSQRQICAGRAVRVQFARIIPDGTGRETVKRVFERLTTYANRAGTDDKPEIEYPIYQVIERDEDLPANGLFGLNPNEHPSLFFPAVGPEPDLWKQLKNPRSTKELKGTLESIYCWLIAAVPGVRNMPEFRRTLCDHTAELSRVRELWNYPASTDRPTSDDKRIEFFAKALAGLMFGRAPATTTKKLSRWRIPRLWIASFEGDKS